MEPKYEVRDAKAEEALNKIGKRLREDMPPGYGFALLLFQYNGENLFYTSSADRADIIKMMKEFIKKQEAELPFTVVDGVHRKSD
jgi:hypothetical protein